MDTKSRERDDSGSTTARWAVFVAGFLFVALDVVLVYALIAPSVSPAVASGVTAATAVVIGGSFLDVLRRQLSGTAGPSDAPGMDSSTGGKSTFARATDVVVATTVLVPLGVFVGNLGGLALWLSASVGGPDPTTDDGDLLRDRLVSWSGRNRAFLRENGRGELPLLP